jgi:hypothetical protein
VKENKILLSSFNKLSQNSKNDFNNNIKSAYDNLKEQYDLIVSEMETKKVEDFRLSFLEKFNTLYRFNSDGHRSDDFQYNPKFLFAGCSETFGWELPEDFVWSKLIYNHFKESKDNYCNLSIPGDSVDNIIFNVFKFFNKYGNPKNLFIMLPNVERSSIVSNDGSRIIIRHYAEYNEKERNTDMTNMVKHNLSASFLFSVNLIRILEQYCDMAGINLKWTTWDKSSGILYNNLNMKNFFDLEMHQEKFINYLAEVKDEWVLDNPGHTNIFLHAYDGIHRGAGPNMYIAKKFMEQIK